MLINIYGILCVGIVNGKGNGNVVFRPDYYFFRYEMSFQRPSQFRLHNANLESKWGRGQ